MNAIELFHADGKPAGICYCGKCRVVHRMKEETEQCCQPPRCRQCGNECSRGWSICDDCRRKQEEQKEAERFAAADKVQEWPGWIYCEGYGFQEGFFQSIEDLLDYCESEAAEIPEYAWICETVRFATINLDDMLQRIEEDTDAYEDFQAETLDGIPELKKAVEAFNEANKDVVAYTPNYKKALLVTPKTESAPCG